MNVTLDGKLHLKCTAALKVYILHPRLPQPMLE